MEFRKVPNKKCPFFKEDCLQNQCKLYHEEFDRCEISLMTFNIYKLMQQLKPNQNLK